MFLSTYTISKLRLPNRKLGFYLNSLGRNAVYYGLCSDSRLIRFKWVCTLGPIEILGIGLVL